MRLFEELWIDSVNRYVGDEIAYESSGGMGVDERRNYD